MPAGRVVEGPDAAGGGAVREGLAGTLAVVLAERTGAAVGFELHPCLLSQDFPGNAQMGAGFFQGMKENAGG